MFGKKKKLENVPVWVMGYDFIYDEENDSVRIFDTTLINGKAIVSFMTRKNKNKYYVLATLNNKETYILDSHYTEDKAIESIHELLYKINLDFTVILDSHIEI